MSDGQWLSNDQLTAWRKTIAVVERLPGILETQLQHDAGMSHFEYFTLAMLSEATDLKLRISELAVKTNATVARLSHVLSRLEKRGLVRREPCPLDGRATNAVLTAAGWDAVVAAAPGHVQTVRSTVLEPLTSADVADLERIMGLILSRMDQ